MARASAKAARARPRRHGSKRCASSCAAHLAGEHAGESSSSQGQADACLPGGPRCAGTISLQGALAAGVASGVGDLTLTRRTASTLALLSPSRLSRAR